MVERGVSTRSEHDLQARSTFIHQLNASARRRFKPFRLP